MRFEGGPHRVQRVPVTENAGRIHTSSATVTVMPEAEWAEREVQLEKAQAKARAKAPARLPAAPDVEAPEA